MEIRSIPLLQKPGVPFSVGYDGFTVIYTSEFIESQLKEIDSDVYLYSDYCDIMSDVNNVDATKYIMKIFTDIILDNVYKEKIHSGVAAVRMKRYDEKTNTITCIVDDNTDVGRKILNVLERDKVYITFILVIDKDDHSKRFKKAALCLGTIGNHILFI